MHCTAICSIPLPPKSFSVMRRTAIYSILLPPNSFSVMHRTAHLRVRFSDAPHFHLQYSIIPLPPNSIVGTATLAAYHSVGFFALFPTTLFATHSLSCFTVFSFHQEADTHEHKQRDNQSRVCGMGFFCLRPRFTGVVQPHS